MSICKTCEVPLTENNRYKSDIKNNCYSCKTCRKAKAISNDKSDEYKSFLRKKRRQLKLKEEVFKNYGTSCYCCNESNFAFLTLDHIFNDGKKDRKNFIGHAFYNYLKENNYPNKDRLRIACMNCNAARGLFKICPHEKARIIKNFQIKANKYFKARL